MNRKSIYTWLHKCTAVFLILSLAWLTVSTPFVCSFFEKVAQMEKSEAAANSTDDSNPLNTSAEEKVPGSTASEEYLHDQHIAKEYVIESSSYNKCEDWGTYLAYHGELLIPPPDRS